MTPYQQRAWECLKEEERQCLFLSISENKSSCEASQIMGITHYKYIELRERAEKFFRLFGDFFEKHEAIFRPDCPCEFSFRSYIEGLIEKRIGTKEARLFTGEAGQIVPKVNHRVINRNMRWLMETKDSWDMDTIRLIREFDRWNQFRILPVMLQQPSAYKRRVNRKYKAYIKYLLHRMPEWFLDKIKEKFWYKTNYPKEKYYIVLVYPSDRYTYKVLPIRPKPEIVSQLTSYYFYVFKTEDEADTFGFMVTRFNVKSRGVSLGQKFWPEFRLIISQAVNYKEINNMDLNVTSLDNAYHINRRKKKMSKDDPTHMKGLTREKDKIFY